MSPDEIKIPPEPPGRCSNHLQVSEGLTARVDENVGVTLSGGAMTFRGYDRKKEPSQTARWAGAYSLGYFL